ncbi:hypothetical protein QYE76_002814 [Lolium multiflorum]|uniref:Integrase catalytic domain-containing protein n=1 Tax=Lolium multiflorum TaxID=4521 RepID=A0AAD8RNY6_LOLMU|nr:hypothetical protein QYE76_002814 [Lolium multiflorum]
MPPWFIPAYFKKTQASKLGDAQGIPFFIDKVSDMASPINFNQFLEKEKLKSNGSNFTDWFRHVRIFLNGGNLQYVLDAPLGDPPAETETDEVKNVYATRKTRCEACLMGKMTKTPFSGMMERATDLLEIIHTDVCGPMSVASRGGYRYVLTFTDDLSRYGYIYLMKHKSETFEKFKEFQSEVENQRNKKIKFLRSDRGGEYLSYEFGMHLKKCGILSQLTPPGTPQRNGVSERRNQTLLDMTAAFTLNRAPSKSVETTPYELWFNKKPKLSFLKVWGCEAYVKKLQPDKLEPKAEKCVFIGYPKETIGYTFYHRSEGKIFVAKNGTFLEKEFLTKEVTGRKVELDEIEESLLVDQSSAVPENVPVPPTPATEEANDNDHETSNETATEPRRSTRDRATPDWYDPCLNVMIVDNNDEDPATYEEAMMSPDSNKWQEAMKSEMGSMYDNKVWTLVDLPDSRKAVENKWIFKRKTDADGNITVYKARLVAKGFRQIQGVDYDETFSPVAKLKSVRILLAIAAFFDYEIWQMDVKTAFLNGDIEEELYMLSEAPPDFFTATDTTPSCCRIQRSYYFRCPLEGEVDVVFINNRTCDRVRRCCPFVAPEPIVIKIFYALLQAASERLPQQQEPPLVGFGISSRATHSGTLGGTSGQSSAATMSSSASQTAEPVKYEDLPPEHKKRYDELKAILEADLIGAFEKTRSHGIKFKGPALGTHQGEVPLYTRPPLQHTFAAPQQQGSPAYVVYKVGGDPGDYQFLYDPPKEIPHGYVCTYVSGCNNWMTQVTREGATARSRWSGKQFRAV